MPMNSENLLQNLRDIHYPEPISNWPAAPGWYILAIIIIVSSIFLGITAYRLYKQYKIRKRLLAQIQQLENLHQTEPNAIQPFIELSTLVKRYLFLLYPKKQVASLNGEEYLSFLDRISKTLDYTKGMGRLMISAPYMGAPPKDAGELFGLVKSLIKQKRVKYV